MKFLVTGGAGFIGSAVVRDLVENRNASVLVLDKLTYAGSLSNLAPVAANERFQFAQVDICDQALVRKEMMDFMPDVVMHLAAETHVDRSIDSPGEFIQTNVVGTFNLLQAALACYQAKSGTERSKFRFHHVSTDEVFGELDEEGFFTEETAYDPHSPYSASKAASDHLARAWHDTYGLPVVLSNCSNNYGPYQFPEKLIPLMILNAMEGKPLPVYGQGLQVRDWLHVEDHADALFNIATKAAPGSSYIVGGRSEVRNVDLVRQICAQLDQLDIPKPKGVNRFEDLIEFVADRPGHDFRYAIDCSRIEDELGWQPKHTLDKGLAETINWYLDNHNWCEEIQQEGARKRRGINQ